MKRAVILGTGGLGRLLVRLLGESGHYEVVALTDKNPVKETTCAGVAVVGDDAISGMLRNSEIDCGFLGLGEGDLVLRSRLFIQFREMGLEFPAFVHSSAYVSPAATIGAGTLVLPKAVVNANATVGDNVVLFSGAIIEHDCEIGDDAYISPGVVLSGGVLVGRGAFLGSGSVAIPKVSIGEGAFVGAGTVVIRDIAPNARVAGVPAKPIDRDRR